MLFTLTRARCFCRQCLLAGAVAISAVLPALPHAIHSSEEHPVWTVLPMHHQPDYHQEPGEGPARSIRADVFASASATGTMYATLPAVTGDANGTVE